MKISINRIVRYIPNMAYGEDEKLFAAGIPAAAIVTRVWSENCVNLTVFTNRNDVVPVVSRTSVMRGEYLGNWNWSDAVPDDLAVPRGAPEPIVQKAKAADEDTTDGTVSTGVQDGTVGGVETASTEGAPADQTGNPVVEPQTAATEQAI